MVLIYKAFFAEDNSKIQVWGSPLVQGWTDADWRGDVESSRSTSGFCLLLPEESPGVRKSKPLSPSPLLKLNISHPRL